MLVRVGLLGLAQSPGVVSGGSCFMAVGWSLVGVGSFSKGSVGVKVLPVLIQPSRGEGHNFITLC